jgi:hypothetical protein
LADRVVRVRRHTAFLRPRRPARIQVGRRQLPGEFQLRRPLRPGICVASSSTSDHLRQQRLPADTYLRVYGLLLRLRPGLAQRQNRLFSTASREPTSSSRLRRRSLVAYLTALTALLG